jgi:hypothetical protein
MPITDYAGGPKTDRHGAFSVIDLGRITQSRTREEPRTRPGRADWAVGVERVLGINKNMLRMLNALTSELESSQTRSRSAPKAAAAHIGIIRQTDLSRAAWRRCPYGLRRRSRRRSYLASGDSRIWATCRASSGTESVAVVHTTSQSTEKYACTSRFLMP